MATEYLSAAKINLLKSKIQAEVARRCGNYYAGSAAKKYDKVTDPGAFTTAPANGGTISLEHGTKTINTLLDIKDISGNIYYVPSNATNFYFPSQYGDTNGQFPSLIAEVDALATKAIDATTLANTGCRGACTRTLSWLLL